MLCPNRLQSEKEGSKIKISSVFCFCYYVLFVSDLRYGWCTIGNYWSFLREIITTKVIFSSNNLNEKSPGHAVNFTFKYLIYGNNHNRYNLDPV